MPASATVENPEQLRYADLYRAQREGRYQAHYGHSNHGSRWIEAIVQSGDKVLDVGCGHNEFAQTLRTRGIDATGVDFACDDADFLADVCTGLPFPDDAFDLVTAFDMLEHLLPEQVECALAEMARVSRRFIFTIAFQPSINMGTDGGNLHPTVMPPEDWERVLAKYAIFTRAGQTFEGEWSTLAKEASA